MTSDGETTKTKVVNLDVIYNIAVENIFIWIHLGFQILISKLDKDNIGRMNISSKHNWLIGGVIREDMHSL
jgi:hypothetical protein